MKILIALIFLAGCVTREIEKPVQTTIISTKYELRAGQWVSCWDQCGKGDSLLAVTETECVCRNGKKFLHAFGPKETPPNTQVNAEIVNKGPNQGEPEPKKQPSKSIFDMLNSIGE